jgi:5'-deoxynucleotidase YfbR-like HD superfamily hydrolase
MGRRDFLMDLNIREMLIGSPVRLRYVYRFSTSRVHHPETVAEHSYYVVLYCMLIGEWCGSREQKTIAPLMVNMEKLMRRAVLHDLEESRSGDFPRPFKHSTHELHDMLERAGQIAFNQALGPTCEGKIPLKLVLSWAESKDTSFEGRILEFADFLSVLSFMYEEAGSGGNRSIMEHVAEMGKYFDKFKSDHYDFIRPLVDQAEVIMKGVFS